MAPPPGPKAENAFSLSSLDIVQRRETVAVGKNHPEDDMLYKAHVGYGLWELQEKTPVRSFSPLT